MPEFKLDPIESWQAGDKADVPPLSKSLDLSNSEHLIGWIETLLHVQTASITRNDFYPAAAEAIVKLIGLQNGMVILKKRDQWQVAAKFASDNQFREQPDGPLLHKVEQERATFYAFGEGSGSDPYVASPIFDSSNQVAGILFGSRQNSPDPSAEGIHKLDALTVQFLAGIVSAGLAQQANQEEADQFRMQLEQFASAKLVSAMSQDPKFLDARERTISVLFGDVRGFTGLAQRVGPEKTFSMIRNLMDQLTGSILDEDGFIIDYAGDGIAAMWNAPADQPDHAELACWAAVNMQKVMDKLSEFWSFVAGESLSAGIGINTGVAQVGNSGSRWRLKYSPLGASVNLASRLEGANKYFGTSILISNETKSRLFSSFPQRPIGPVVVKGALGPVEVFQLMTEREFNMTPKLTLNQYKLALQEFRNREFDTAVRTLEKSLSQHDDPLSHCLLEQCLRESKNASESPAIRLETK